MTYTHIAKLPSHAIFTPHDIIELMIQEYLSMIEEPMISEYMNHNEIKFVQLTLMNSNSLFKKLKHNPDLNIDFLKNYTDDIELNQAIYETLALIKELQQHNSNLEDIVLTLPLDFEDHIRNQTLGANPMPFEVQENIDWTELAELKRTEYEEINLNYPTIGFNGTWIINKRLFC